MDFLLKQQAQRLFALQELQIELMEELSRRHVSNGTSSSAERGEAPAPGKTTHPPKGD
jgi:hypothetical protein